MTKPIKTIMIRIFLLTTTLLFLICSSGFAQYGLYDDFDGDSILNANDLDDDNDGIPDSEEDSKCIFLIEDFDVGPYPGPPVSGSSSTQFIYSSDPVSYTHLTLPTTPYV